MPLTRRERSKDEIEDVPSLVWTQLSAAERGYLLSTHVGRIPLWTMVDARHRQFMDASPSIEDVAASLRRLIPVVEQAAQECRDAINRLNGPCSDLNRHELAMNERRLSEMRAVLAEIEASSEETLQQAAE